jgi:hypothetical protein
MKRNRKPIPRRNLTYLREPIGTLELVIMSVFCAVAIFGCIVPAILVVLL